jgi:hypothetical protein
MQPIDPRFELAFSVRVPGQPHGKGSVRVLHKEDPKPGEPKVKGIQAPKSKTYETKIAWSTGHSGIERPEASKGCPQGHAPGLR